MNEPKMKAIVHMVPEAWKPGKCDDCNLYDACRQSTELEEEKHCPLANAREVHPIKDLVVRSQNGEPFDVFVMKKGISS